MGFTKTLVKHVTLWLTVIYKLYNITLNTNTAFLAHRAPRLINSKPNALSLELWHIFSYLFSFVLDIQRIELTCSHVVHA